MSKELVVESLATESLATMKDNLVLTFSEEETGTPNPLSEELPPKFEKPPGTAPPSYSAFDDDEEDNRFLSWGVKRIMVPVSSKGKDKVLDTQGVRSKAHLTTRSSAKKLMSEQ